MLIIVACGGKFADDTSIDPNATDADASVAPEASPFPPPAVDAAPPPSSQCTNTVIDVEQTGDVCAASEKWSCDSDDYEFRCACPQGTCECWQNGHQKKLVGEVVQCPGCIEPQNAVAICNFPH